MPEPTRPTIRRPAQIVMPDRPDQGSTLSVLLEGERRPKGPWVFAVIAAVIIHLFAFIFLVLPARAEVTMFRIPVKDYAPTKDFKPVPPEPEPQIVQPRHPTERVITIPVPNLPEPDIVEPRRSAQPVIDQPIDPSPFQVVVPGPPPVQATATVDIAELGVSAPTVIQRFQPRYPTPAMRAGFEGAVILQLLIDTEGRVEEVKVVRGLPLGLTEAAVSAAKRWLFVPMHLGDRPVRVRYTLTVNFNIR